MSSPFSGRAGRRASTSRAACSFSVVSRDFGLQRQGDGPTQQRTGAIEEHAEHFNRALIFVLPSIVPTWPQLGHFAGLRPLKLCGA
jgi:hypothetical protein